MSTTETETNHQADGRGEQQTAGRNRRDSRSVSDLFRELRDESTALVREEVALAKAEMSEKASSVSSNATTLIIGGAVAHLGLIFLLLAASYGLYVAIGSAGLPVHALWIAPLIVGVVVGGIGLAMAIKAKNSLVNTSPVPRKTIDSLREDKQWAAAKTR